MGEAIAKVIAITASEDLSLGLQATEGTCVDYPITVALKVIAIRVCRLRIAPSP